MQVIILVSKKTLDKLKPLMCDGESYDSVISDIVDYVGFHSDEYKSSRS